MRGAAARKPVGRIQFAQLDAGLAHTTFAGANEERFRCGKVGGRYVGIQMKAGHFYAGTQPTGAARKREELICLGVVLRQRHAGRHKASMTVRASTG